MGLSLSYELRLQGDAAAARECLRQLHDFARTLEFAEVLDVVEWPVPETAVAEDELSSEQVQLLRMFGTQYGQKQMRDGTHVWVEIPPRHVMAFGVQLAEGSEMAQFGFASHPAIVEYQHKGETLLIETGLTGQYSWTHCCKTQYAGLQQHGGVANFLFAHVGLVRCLDLLAGLGVEVHVRDDSEYWEHRDEARLRGALAEWNEMIAAVAGQLKDRLGSDPQHGISAPILTAPNFEHLEAKGLDAWTKPAGDDPPPTGDGK